MMQLKRKSITKTIFTIKQLKNEELWKLKNIQNLQ
jgi:hypothetical protein